MPLDLSRDADSATWVLEGEFTIYHAAAIKTALLACLSEAAETRLDLSGVTEIDTSGIQLLMLLQREAHSRSIKLELQNLSQPSASAIELLRLTPMLDIQNTRVEEAIK